mmetsp:Transcript_2182/g.4990  ORF Transcript_2182/g.4990 Transcript_2182/m.4990 type:complete len:140 (+) Transcript_2182:718-1137(+)
MPAWLSKGETLSTSVESVATASANGTPPIRPCRAWWKTGGGRCAAVFRGAVIVPARRDGQEEDGCPGSARNANGCATPFHLLGGCLHQGPVPGPTWLEAKGSDTSDDCSKEATRVNTHGKNKRSSTSTRQRKHRLPEMC